MALISRLTIAAVTALSMAGSVSAGGLGAAVVEGEPFAVEEVAGAGGIGALPLVLLGILVVAAVAGGGSSNGTPPEAPE